jgi:hypothetical protein
LAHQPIDLAEEVISGRYTQEGIVGLDALQSWPVQGPLGDVEPVAAVQTDEQNSLKLAMLGSTRAGGGSLGCHHRRLSTWLDLKRVNSTILMPARLTAQPDGWYPPDM